MGYLSTSLGEELAQADCSLFAERLRLTRDGFANACAYVLSAASGMALVPVLLTGLSREMYGVWIAALALQYSASFLAGGVGRSVAREVAASPNREDSIAFVSLAANLYALVGLTGAILIAIAGLPLSSGIHVQPQNLTVARFVFVIAGLAFGVDQMQAFALEILTGLRQFLTINTVMTGSAVLRVVGMVVVLKASDSILAAAAWHLAVTVAAALGSYLLALNAAPQFRLRLRRIDWRGLRAQMEFSLVGQMASGCSNFLWRSAPFLIGLLRGATAIVPYELGQKFPMAISSGAWHAAEALYPAASEYQSAERDAHTQQLLEVGTRGLLFFVLPICTTLWIAAPHLLSTWVGYGFREAIWITRLMLLAVLADTAAATCIQVLWAHGKVNSVLAVTVFATLVSLAVTWPLVIRFGPIGAAAGLALAVSLASVCYLVLVTNTCGCGVREILVSPLVDFAMPLSISVGVALFFFSLPHQGWLFLAFGGVLALITYFVAFYSCGADPAEKMVAQRAVSRLKKVLYAMYRSLRSALERVPFFRRCISLAVELKNTLLDSSQRDRAAVERMYQGTEDPFGFRRELEQFRFRRALEMLNTGSQGRRFARALEVGCSEGMFTEMLAGYCDSLFAVDLSEVALHRAEQRCKAGTNIQFAAWDVRKDTLDGTFDLIVATGVLEYIYRPSTLRKACDRLARALRPGGYLLLGNTVTGDNLEQTWIGKKLLRGTVINDYVAGDPRFELVASSVDQCVCPFAHSLLRRLPDQA